MKPMLILTFLVGYLPLAEASILLIREDTECFTQRRVSEAFALNTKKVIDAGKWGVYIRGGHQDEIDALLTGISWMVKVVTKDYNTERITIEVTFYKVANVNNVWNYHEQVDASESYDFPPMGCSESPSESVMKKFENWVKSRITYLTLKHKLAPLVKVLESDVSGIATSPDNNKIKTALAKLPKMLLEHGLASKLRFSISDQNQADTSLQCIASKRGGTIKVKVALQGDIDKESELSFQENVLQLLLDDLNRKI